MTQKQFRSPAAIREVVFKYISKERPIPLKDFLKNNHILKMTYFKYLGQWELLLEQNTKEHQVEEWKRKKNVYLKAQGFEVVKKTEEDEVIEALRKMAVARNNATAAKFYLQAKGKFVENQKTEIDFKINGGDIARAVIKARRERGEDFGVDEVSGELSPLLEQPRLPPGQSTGEDG